ncbi:MAG: beta-ribofuranosylaminobenzene 5'-phosphate synthase family protein [Candidatus Bathyarchaeia archaeon]
MKVQVKTPARLHLGLIDMNGDLGRMFGGLGVGIDHPNIIVQAQNAENFSITGQETELATILAKRFFSAYKVQPKVQMNIVRAFPSHIGLGSGTQFSLAIATALATQLDVEATIPELAVAMGRARRTAVGTSIFERGGFVVDGGKNLNTTKCPPLIYRQPFPKEWRFIVAVPNLKEGLSNSEENHAFDRLTKMSTEDVGQICRLIMLKLLPALAEKDIESFGNALTKIQIITGNHFAQAQGGTYSSPAAADCIQFMKKAGAYGVGQSSWGPALYAVVKQEEAKAVLSKVKAYLREGVGGQAFIAKANNKGATIRVIED